MARLSQLFAPKEREFFDLFEEAGAQHRARRRPARADARRSGPTTASSARDILVCEQEGDRITHDIIQRLNQTFVTPIDREDIFALASALDDIVDFIEEVADFLGALQDRGADGAGAAARARSCTRPAAADRRRRSRGCATSSDIRHYTVEINRLENEGDRVVREALASLFERGHRPDGRDPLEGHLRAARGRDRRDRDGGEHPRGHRHQEHLTGSPAMDTDIVLWIVVATALAFDFTNGFHDTANVVATSISTRALPPRVAVTLAAILNFVGAFLSLAGRRDDRQAASSTPTSITPTIVFAGLIGAIAWNLAHLVLRAAVVVLARADRRRRRRGVRRRRARARSTATGCVDKVIDPGARRAGARVRRRRRRRS